MGISIADSIYKTVVGGIEALAFVFVTFLVIILAMVCLNFIFAFDKWLGKKHKTKYGMMDGLKNRLNEKGE